MGPAFAIKPAEMTSRRMWIPRSIDEIKIVPRFALAAAAIFHLSITLSVFAVGRLGLAPQQLDSDGCGQFDSRVYKSDVDELVDTLEDGQIRSWFNSPDALHVKIYSLSVLPTRPLVGTNILAVEPFNLLYYLGILALTFSLGKIIAGLRAAWLASLIVAIWPSLVLHTTQFLRDPLVVTGFLALITVLVLLLRENLTWRYATGATMAGALSIYILSRARAEISLVIVGVVFLGSSLLLIKMACLRKLLVLNLIAFALLAVITVATSRPAASVKRPLSGNAVSSSIWDRIALARKRFIIWGGLTIDPDVVLDSPTDVIRYIPRALEIGYLAPFPSMWFESGNRVGLIGRIVSGIETALTYLFEILACVFLWKNKKQFSSWLLVLTTIVGMLALGLVVANVGTLYRMRYPFWILIVIMAASFLASKRFGLFSDKRQTPAASIT